MFSEKAMATHSSTIAWKIPWTEEPGGLQSMGSRRVRHAWATSLSLFHFHALEKEMATHSSVLAWRIPGTPEPGGLPSMGSHRVGHDWSNLAAAARIVLLLSWASSFNSHNTTIVCVCLVAQSCPTLCDPMDCSPSGFSVHEDSPGKNTGVGCCALLQGIFPTQKYNPDLPHWRRILYVWATREVQQSY